jgi:predicted Fe-Mo cluster-binding NifX family protein
MEIDSSIYNLPARTKLRAIGENHIGIVKLIKSRIIQKDAVKIVEMSKQMKKAQPNLEVSLICTSAICSKSMALLQSEGISVIMEEL